MALLLLAPVALQVDLRVLFLEHLGWRRPNTGGFACAIPVVCSYVRLRNIKCTSSLSFLKFETRPLTHGKFLKSRLDPTRTN